LKLGKPGWRPRSASAVGYAARPPGQAQRIARRLCTNLSRHAKPLHSLGRLYSSLLFHVRLQQLLRIADEQFHETALSTNRGGKVATVASFEEHGAWIFPDHDKRSVLASNINVDRDIWNQIL